METWQIVLAVVSPVVVGLLWAASIMWVKKARATRVVVAAAICMILVLVASVVPLQQVSARSAEARNAAFTNAIELFKVAYTLDEGGPEVALDRLVKSSDTYFAFWTEEGDDAIYVSVLCEGLFGDKWNVFGTLTIENPE